MCYQNFPAVTLAKTFPLWVSPRLAEWGDDATLLSEESRRCPEVLSTLPVAC